MSAATTPDVRLRTCQRRFQQLGLCLGGGSGMEHLHYLLENPWQSTLPGACRKRTLSFEFLKAVESESDFETSPMYAIGHEAIYCNGPGASSSWSAQRIMAEFPGMQTSCMHLAHVSMRQLATAPASRRPSPPFGVLEVRVSRLGLQGWRGLS